MERTKSNPWWRNFCLGGIGLCASAILSSSLALAQVQSPGLTSLPSAEQIIQRNQDPYSGSIPQGKATSGIIDLTVEDALDRGLKYNLGLYLSERVTEQSRADRLRSLGELMPVVNGGFSEAVRPAESESFWIYLSRLSNVGRSFRSDRAAGKRLLESS